MSKAPAFQFYPGDWLRDPGLQAASSRTRGAWINLLCRMWDSEERGRLKGTSDQVRKLAGCEVNEWSEILDELVTLKIAEVTLGDKKMTVENRRMVREHKKLESHKLRQTRYRERRVSDAEVTPVSSSSSSTSSSFSSSKKKNTHAKKAYGEFKNVLLTDEEMEKLKSFHPDFLDAIKFLSEAKEMKGYKYKSDYLALKKWVFNALKEHKPKSGKSIMPEMQATFEETMRRYGGKHDTQ